MSDILSRDELIFPLKSVGIGTYEWDVLEGIMRWDAQMYVLFGLDPGSFSGKYNDFLALVDSSDRLRLTQEIAAGLYKAQEFGCEFRISLLAPRRCVTSKCVSNYALVQRTRRGT